MEAHANKLEVLHSLESLAELEVNLGKIPQAVAEVAIWSCIGWIEETNEEKGILYE